MRPLSLEIEGFLAYRRKAEVDFRDADLFVLEGATGSGKSSVIDAIIFALYGTVPRLGHRSAVAPVINATADTAKVRFEFSIDDRAYQVARRVQRTSTGAKVSEARLESEGKTIESGSKEVTAAVGDLLGLGFEHFTKAVVLPQGAFAEFLTDTPAERQDLLRALLDLGLFEQIKMIANERASMSRGRQQSLADSLERLAVPDPGEVKRAKKALRKLEAARSELGERMAEIGARRRTLAEAAAKEAVMTERMARYEAAGPPRDFEELAADIARVRETRDDLNARAEDLAARHTELSARVHESPNKGALEGFLRSHRNLKALKDAAAALRIDEVAQRLAESERVIVELRSRYDELRSAHSAHDLRRSLRQGELCPVCAQEVHQVPVASGPKAVEIEKLKDSLESAESEAAAIVAELAGMRGQEQQISKQIEDEEALLSEAPDEGAVVTALAALEGLLIELSQVETRIEAAKELSRQARVSASATVESAEALKVALYQQRAIVGEDGPPELSDDVVESWRRFDMWRLERLAEWKTEGAAATEIREQLGAGLEHLESDLGGWLELLGVTAGESPETALALAAAAQRTLIADMSRTIESAASMRSQIKEEAARGTVAAALGQHLKANSFEAWVMTEALEALVEGANQLLGDLSSGAYSLVVEKGGFAVVDHRNADLTRTTRSLSGGEVFLVSLSLALSMASRLANLTGAASRLESVFLDEGFGALDRESLDTVATVLDELVVQGRTVGIVTHVRELAERIPVRFEVVKQPGTATIRRRP